MWWHTLPEHLPIIVFTLGGVAIRAYALFFVAGVLLVYALSTRALTKKFSLAEFDIEQASFWMILWGLIGAKLGFLILYTLPFAHTIDPSLYWPYREGAWQGIRGMSFFGGVIGAAAYLWYRTRSEHSLFWKAADGITLYTPLGIFLGRLGNFWNHELIGKATNAPWGVYFPDVPFLRHPSPIYEAVLEGLVLFGLLYWLSRKAWVKEVPSRLSGFFWLGYGALRFLAEQWREPDPLSGLVGGLSLGAWLSLSAIALGWYILWWSTRPKTAIVGKQQTPKYG